MPSFIRTPFLWLVLLWATLLSVITIFETRLPSTDVFLFKEAGVNLAQKGRFVVANLPNMPSDVELPYAYYPPVYPAIFGVWSSVVGVGLKQSILLDHLLMALRSLLIFCFIFPYLKKASESRRGKVIGVLVGLFLVGLAFVTSDGDRPDELALVFGLSSWLLLKANVCNWRRLLLGGVLLGLCGASSPTAGSFFAMGFVFFHLRDSLFWKRFLTVSVTAFVCFLGCNLPVYLSDPAAWVLFSKQLPLSTFPYHLPFVNEATLGEFLTTFLSAFERSFSAGFVHVFAVIGLVIAGVLAAVRGLGSAGERSFIWTSALFIVVCPLVWTLQPYYFWFASVALITALLGILLKESHQAKEAAWIAFVVVLSLSPLFLREVKMHAHGIKRPSVEASQVIQKQVLSYVEPTQKLAVMADQYFTFRAKKELGNLTYQCDSLDRYDYVYVTAVTGHRLRPSPTPIPCVAKRGCFEFVKDFAANVPFSIFGKETNYFVKANGGALYKNTKCTSG